MTLEELAEFKVGDQVQILYSSPRMWEHFRTGELATLTRQDYDGDWWGDLEKGNSACLTEQGCRITKEHMICPDPEII